MRLGAVVDLPQRWRGKIWAWTHTESELQTNVTYRAQGVHKQDERRMRDKTASSDQELKRRPPVQSRLQLAELSSYWL